MKKYMIKNLDCANCAAKIESVLKKCSFVRAISIDFATLSMFIDTESIEKVILEMRKIEPDIEIIDSEKNITKNGQIKGEFNPRKELWLTAICVVGYLFAIIFQKRLTETIELGTWVVFIVIYFVSGWKVLFKAIKNLRNGGFFDENFLMMIATLGAFAIGELPEAVGVMIFFKVGSYLQDLSIYRSRKSIKALLEIRPDYANVVHNSQIVRVAPEEIPINSEIIVQPGEKIPLDGEIISGSSQLDTSALTGESVPISVHEKDNVLAGVINLTGLLKIRVTKLFSESSISKILAMVENATHKKAKTEMFFTTFAKYYTPIIVGIALLTATIPPLLINEARFSEWIYRSLVILVISCPCALVVSIPLAYFGGIGGASKKGILIKGSSFLDTLTNVKTIVFDKTGTLTKGVFEVSHIESVSNPIETFEDEQNRDSELLKITAEAEAHSNHPIASSILRAYGKKIDYTVIQDYKETAGKGISATIRGMHVLVGNAIYMKENNIEFSETVHVGTVVYTAINNLFAGYIVINDELKSDSVDAIKKLRKMGVNSMQMLSGDNHRIAEDISMKLGFNSFHANLLPEDKVNRLEQLIEKRVKNEKLIYVGDGINDAPVLALADIGISMGCLGTDAAIETADVVIMNDSLTKIPELIKISRKNRKIILQNVSFALGIKLLFLVLGISDHASMWHAVFADVGVTLIAVFNATRMLR